MMHNGQICCGYALGAWSCAVAAGISAMGYGCELDGQVRHLLDSMMLGKPRELAPAEQLTIAAWAPMWSMVVEYSWEAEQVVVL